MILRNITSIFILFPKETKSIYLWIERSIYMDRKGFVNSSDMHKELYVSLILEDFHIHAIYSKFTDSADNVQSKIDHIYHDQYMAPSANIFPYRT